MHKTQRSRYLIGFSYEKFAGRRYDNVFVWLNPVEKCAQSTAVLLKQRKSDVMTYFSHSTRSAIYYKAGSPIDFCPLEVAE
jgi:hypothetical protein